MAEIKRKTLKLAEILKNNDFLEKKNGGLEDFFFTQEFFRQNYSNRLGPNRGSCAGVLPLSGVAPPFLSHSKRFGTFIPVCM
jgi:hypothetical protein